MNPQALQEKSELQFSCKNALLLAGAFFGSFIVGHYIEIFIRKVIEFDSAPYWPISVFLPRLPDWRFIVFAFALGFFFFLSTGYLSRMRYKLWLVVPLGVGLVLATNLLQGWRNGFILPIAGGISRGIQYYHDAIKIQDPLLFLRQFETIQVDLLLHSRTCPPGAVLTIYALNKIFGHPGYIALCLAVVSSVLSMLFLSGILRRELANNELSGYLTFLFILIPAVQIYYVATLDALLAACMLGALYFFLHPKPVVSVAGALVFLFLASFLKFLVLFILPVLAGFEILKKRAPIKTGVLVLGLVAIYVVMQISFNFNYLNSFMTASALENPEGFRLLADPVSYVFTRLADILEIVLFFGPFLGILAIRSMRGTRLRDCPRSNLLLLAWLGFFSLGAMFLVGVFPSGETGRVCLFFYPYLIFPVAAYLNGANLPNRTLLFLVFAQTVLMQLFGFYFW